MFQKEYGSKFKDNRDKDKEEKEKPIKRKLGGHPSNEKLKQQNIVDLLWDYDAVSLNSSSKWADKSIYPMIETR